jgi:hypothetical protein
MKTKTSTLAPSKKKIAPKKTVKKKAVKKSCKSKFPSKEEIIKATEALHALTEKYKGINLGYICCMVSLESGQRVVRGHHMSPKMIVLATEVIVKQI